MRQRSNLIILFGIAFFLVGGAIVYLVLNDEDDGGSAASSTDGVAQVSILVASADIPANTIGTDAIEQGLLTTEEVDATQAASALTSADQLQNRIFAVDVEEGAAISTGQLATRSLSNIPIPEGFDGVAVTVDYTEAGAGYIAPGDTVNVYGLFGDQVSDGGLATGVDVDGTRLPRTELALTNVQVLGVSEQQQTAAQAAATTQTTTPTGTLERAQSNRPITYLLAVRPTDAERIIHLNRFASVYLALTADGAGPVGDTPGVAGDNVNDPVSADSAAPQS